MDNWEKVKNEAAGKASIDFHEYMNIYFTVAFKKGADFGRAYSQSEIQAELKEQCLINQAGQERELNLQAKYEKALDALKFYADLYVFDIETADDDCEQDISKPWRFVSGKLARQILKELGEM